MVTNNTNMSDTSEVLFRKFKRVKNGLDEAEVLSAIKELIEQNRNLTNRFAHLDSLTKLAERTIIQAEEEAVTIKKEAELAATSTADSIIATAKEQAKSEADKIRAEARQRADEAVHAMLTSAQHQGEEIMKAAETQAAYQAEEIVKAAETRAQQRSQELILQSRKMLERTIVERFTKLVENLLAEAEEIEAPHP